MKKVAFAVWVATLILALTASGVFAQTPAASPSQLDVNANQTTPAPLTEFNVNATDTTAPAPAASVAADVNINRTETTPAPATTSTSAEVWGLDGTTVLIGGTLLLGIILIAVAAAGHDRPTPVAR